MGLVYRAEQITLGKIVAIKVLKREYSDQKIYLERFLQEARAASQIGHDNVVDIIDFGQIAGGSAFFAMEHLHGEDLDQLLDRAGMLPWPRVKVIVQQVMRALGAAHAKGIVHRDMKPANCFMVRRADGVDQVKVFDFGIAKVIDPHNEGGVGLTQTGAIFGTAKYMAPEQARGEKVDQRTDIYALGVMIYELLTGRVPFAGDNFMQVLTQHLTEAPPSLITVAPEAGIPLEVEAMVLKALAKDPADRYPSMAEFEASMLELDGEVRAPTGELGEGDGRVAPTQFEPDIDLSQLTQLRRGGARRFVLVGLMVVVLALAGFFGLRGAGDERSRSGAEPPSVSGAVSGSPHGVASAGPNLGGVPSATQGVAASIFPTAPEPEPLAPESASLTSPTLAKPAKPRRKKPRRSSGRSGRSGSSSSASLPPPPSASSPVAEPALTGTSIRRALTAVDGKIKACRTRHGGIAGMTVKVRFMISASAGEVMTASALKPHATTELGSCVAHAVKKAQFPKGQTKVLTRSFRL